MAENLSIEAPDFDRIRKGDAPATEDAVRLLWYVLNNEIKLRRIGQRALQASIGKMLFNHFADAGNTTTAETDLYSDSIPGDTLVSNGSKVIAEYAGIFVNSTSTKKIKAYFAGTAIFDSGALATAATSYWRLEIIVLRESSTIVRCSVSLIDTGTGTLSATTYTRITGLTLSVANILKFTGTAAGAGAATNDIVAKLGTVRFEAAA